jgi:DNA polymerase zeta
MVYFWTRVPTISDKVPGVDAIDLLGRAPNRISGLSMDNWSTRHTSNVKIAGRHVLNVWRLMRTELTLGIYTLENVVNHVLKQRIPTYRNQTLKKWITNGTPAQSSRVLFYMADRASIVLELLDETRIVIKTAYALSCYKVTS